MTPTAVRVAASIAATFSPTDLATYGNVLAPTYRSWLGRSSSYFTEQLPNSYSQQPGTPTTISYWIPQFINVAGNQVPTWAQPPHRMRSGVYGGVLYPVANSTVEPPIGSLT